MFYFILEKSCFGLIFVREDGNISPGGGGGGECLSKFPQPHIRAQQCPSQIERGSSSFIMTALPPADLYCSIYQLHSYILLYTGSLAGMGICFSVFRANHSFFVSKRAIHKGKRATCSHFSFVKSDMSESLTIALL